MYMSSKKGRRGRASVALPCTSPYLALSNVTTCPFFSFGCVYTVPMVLLLASCLEPSYGLWRPFGSSGAYRGMPLSWLRRCLRCLMRV